MAVRGRWSQTFYASANWRGEFADRREPDPAYSNIVRFYEQVTRFRNGTSMAEARISPIKEACLLRVAYRFRRYSEGIVQQRGRRLSALSILTVAGSNLKEKG